MDAVFARSVDCQDSSVGADMSDGHRAIEDCLTRPAKECEALHAGQHCGVLGAKLMLQHCTLWLHHIGVPLNGVGVRLILGPLIPFSESFVLFFWILRTSRTRTR
jgi:hypothetical protein